MQDLENGNTEDGDGEDGLMDNSECALQQRLIEHWEGVRAIPKLLGVDTHVYSDRTHLHHESGAQKIEDLSKR
jgi:hypothetical protein